MFTGAMFTARCSPARDDNEGSPTAIVFGPKTAQPKLWTMKVQDLSRRHPDDVNSRRDCSTALEARRLMAPLQASMGAGVKRVLAAISPNICASPGASPGPKRKRFRATQALQGSPKLRQQVLSSPSAWISAANSWVANWQAENGLDAQLKAAAAAAAQPTSVPASCAVCADGETSGSDGFESADDEDELPMALPTALPATIPAAPPRTPGLLATAVVPSPRGDMLRSPRLVSRRVSWSPCAKSPTASRLKLHAQARKLSMAHLGEVDPVTDEMSQPGPRRSRRTSTVEKQKAQVAKSSGSNRRRSSRTSRDKAAVED